MRKNMSKIVSFLCMTSLALGLCGSVARVTDAAKKPKLSSSKVTIEIGKSKTVKIKNSVKSAKVKWKTNDETIAAISKKKSGKKASVKITGVSAGQTKVSAVYKVGKKKKTFKCKVTVPNNTPVTPIETGTNTIPQPDNGSKDSVNNTTTDTQATQQPDATPTDTNGSETPATEQPTEEPIKVFKWVTTWGTAEEKNDISADSAMPKIPLSGSTIRQIIRVTTSGEKIKLRLSNQYGGSDVKIKSMHLAKQVEVDKSKIYTDTDTVVTVDGSESFTIPKGKLIETDEIEFSVEALENVAVSMYFESAPSNNITGHRGARATTYQMSGNNVSKEVFTNYQTTTSWFFLADVSLWVPEEGRAVVCFGDSITDGYGTDASYLGKKPDSYTRWADYFAKRLQANEKTKYVSVINEGIGANAILGSYPTDSGSTRFARDLLQHDGVAYCIILFGVNDLNKLNNTDKFNQLLPEYKKMVKLCHDNDIKVYGAPILPFGTSDYYSTSSEQVRNMINNWMRSEESGMDGIINFEKAVADPANPKNILEKYTHQDGLHPYDGYDVMAEAIDLSLFE